MNSFIFHLFKEGEQPRLQFECFSVHKSISILRVQEERLQTNENIILLNKKWTLECLCHSLSTFKEVITLTFLRLWTALYEMTVSDKKNWKNIGTRFSIQKNNYLIFSRTVSDISTS